MPRSSQKARVLRSRGFQGDIEAALRCVNNVLGLFGPFRFVSADVFLFFLRMANEALESPNGEALLLKLRLLSEQSISEAHAFMLEHRAHLPPSRETTRVCTAIEAEYAEQQGRDPATWPRFAQQRSKGNKKSNLSPISPDC